LIPRTRRVTRRHTPQNLERIWRRWEEWAAWFVNRNVATRKIKFEFAAIGAFTEIASFDISLPQTTALLIFMDGAGHHRAVEQ
jgi:hypothetical protein